MRFDDIGKLVAYKLIPAVRLQLIRGESKGSSLGALRSAKNKFASTALTARMVHACALSQSQNPLPLLCSRALQTLITFIVSEKLRELAGMPSL